MNIDKFIDGLHGYLTEVFRPINQRHRDLELRVAALEQRQTRSLADSYAGGWQPSITYKRGSLATFHGSLWLALEDSADRPASSAKWRMIVRGLRE